MVLRAATKMKRSSRDRDGLIHPVRIVNPAAKPPPVLNLLLVAHPRVGVYNWQSGKALSGIGLYRARPLGERYTHELRGIGGSWNWRCS